MKNKKLTAILFLATLNSVQAEDLSQPTQQ